jgi:hypothetical protein
MKKYRHILFILLFFVNTMIYTEEDNNNNINNEYYDFDGAGGITIYGERQKEFAPESIETYILNQLNENSSAREQFIETEFLEKSGFRRTGTIKYRKSEGSEKTLSVLHGVAHLFSFGIVPMKPYFEIEYGELPKGQYYTFESVMISSQFTKVSPEVWNILKIEYMLQIEFCNGILIRDNMNYYTDENIGKFETLILKLPDYPESVLKAKTRFLNELVKIKASLERYKNPSEDQKRTLENLRNSFRMNNE